MPTQVVRDADVTAGALHSRHPVEVFTELRAQPIDVHPYLGQEMARGATFLVEQRHHHVGGLDELVIASHGQALRVGQRHLELGGELIHAHRD